MPRIVKHPELRRSEILDCAQAMFLAHGYDNASLNDIIAEAGVSKGAFYHYFASKEALLEALASRFAQQALMQIQDVLDAPGLDALTRLNAVMARSRRSKMENAATQWALFDVLLRPENVVLFHRINVAATSLFTPAFAKIVAQGVEEGIFATFDPDGVADLLLQLGASMHGILVRAIRSEGEEMDAAIEALERRIRLYEIAIDHVLGLPDGSVQLAEPGYMRTMMMARLEAEAGCTLKARSRSGTAVVPSARRRG